MKPEVNKSYLKHRGFTLLEKVAAQEGFPLKQDLYLDIVEAADAIFQPVLNCKPSKSSVSHLVLYVIVRDSYFASNMHRAIRSRASGTIPYSYESADKEHLTPIGKAEIRRVYKRMFGRELVPDRLRESLDLLVRLKLLVPVDNLYLINLPYIIRLITGYKYEPRDTTQAA